jgi:cytochrome c556
MRHLLLLGLGLVVGAMLAGIVANTLARRAAYARGVMQVMQHQYGELRDAMRRGRCEGDFAPQRDLLARLTEEIGPATHGDDTPEASFREYTQRLRDAVAALPPAGASCSALAPATMKIGDACEACHRQYR